MIGVYCIVNKVNNKRYVGQSNNINRRIARHKYDLKGNKHANGYLQNAWNKYGADNFEFERLANAPISELNSLEINLIKEFKSYGEGYNLTAGGESGYTSFLGRKHSVESKRKMSEAKVGRTLPESTIMKMKESAKGFKGPHTEESKRKMSASHKGKTLSEETIAKISAGRMGKRHTKEAKEKIAEKHRGKTLSDATKQKISKSKQYKFTKEESKEIIDRVKKDESYRSIAKDFDCSYMTIRRRFKNKRGE